MLLCEAMAVLPESAVALLLCLAVAVPPPVAVAVLPRTALALEMSSVMQTESP